MVEIREGATIPELLREIALEKRGGEEDQAAIVCAMGADALDYAGDLIQAVREVAMVKGYKEILALFPEAMGEHGPYLPGDDQT